MATLVGKQNRLSNFLKAIINMEKDALQAYWEMIDRLDDRDAAGKIADFIEDHNRHLSELTRISLINGTDIPDGTIKSALTAGKIMLADLFGDDKIFRVMASYENDTVTAYDNALKQDYCSGDLRAVCEQALRDEMRHRKWMEATAERLRNAA